MHDKSNGALFCSRFHTLAENVMQPTASDQLSLKGVIRSLGRFTEKVWVLIEISLNFVPNDPIVNDSTFEAWRLTNDKPLLEPIFTNMSGTIWRY